MSSHHSLFHPTCLVLLAATLTLAACQSSELLSLLSHPASPAPALALTASPSQLSVPAGASATFDLRLTFTDETRPTSSLWAVQNLPNGLDAYFLGNPTPWQNRLVVTTHGQLASGDYPFAVVATTDTGTLTAPLTLTITDCVDTETGNFTHDIQSNLVELITAGKPAKESGLLVPIQVCAHGHYSRRLHVTLKQAISETGTVLTDAPPFYLYRSRVWPAPAYILAHQVGPINVDLPRENHTDWELDAEVTPGLYLLIFENDRYPNTPPEAAPATVTYELTLKP